MNGKKLRELRKASGKTLREISYEADVTFATIQSIESGKTPNPGIRVLYALAKAIGCKVDDFLD